MLNSYRNFLYHTRILKNYYERNSKKKKSVLRPPVSPTVGRQIIDLSGDILLRGVSKIQNSICLTFLQSRLRKRQM